MTTTEPAYLTGKRTQESSGGLLNAQYRGVWIDDLPPLEGTACGELAVVSSPLDYGDCMRHPPTQRAEKLAERFTDFYARMYNPMHRLLARTAVGADQEAMLHDAFEVVWLHLLRTGNLDRRWFIQVVRNKVGDFYRAAARRERPTDGMTIPEPAQPDDTADAWANRVDVQQAMLRLPTDKYEVLVLAFWCDLPTAEAAALLGISQTAFSTRLSRAKRAFAAEYDRPPTPSDKQVSRREVTEWTD